MAHYPTRGHGLARVASELRRDDRVDALLAALGGERTLWQLVQGPGAVRALAAVWVLEAARAIQWRDAPTGASAQAPRVEILVKAQGQARERPRSRRAARGPAAPGTPAPAAAEALVRNILERFEHLEGLDHYALLGIDRGADSADVKRAYLTAAKTYHPDVIARAGLDGETRVRANKVFAAIGKAYATLSDPQRRRQYDLGLGSGAERDAERLATAEGLYRKGEVLLRQGNFRGAVEFLEPAVELWPEEAEYQSALGWALYKKLPSEPERARTHLEAAATLDPSDQSVIFRLGVVMRSLGTQAAR
jgi:DnaJ-domain-containing protein 1